ncbi:20698_t:CDS:2 [Entrophospora sp. SA101]|nr:20698_t:CDS:2 [Entrophospora sp. SA101]
MIFALFYHACYYFIGRLYKFAGNVIVYRDGQGIWYGRVIPCHVESIIESTVIEGKVIKDLYRGSMNGSFAPGKVNSRDTILSSVSSRVVILKIDDTLTVPSMADGYILLGELNIFPPE